MLNIETILHLHIVDENNKRDEYYKQFKGKHSASSAGYCYKKQYYQLHGYKGEPMDKRVLRLLRVGTLLHKDLEESLGCGSVLLFILIIFIIVMVYNLIF